MAERVLRLGTRGSKLARWQADWTAARLTQLGHQVEIVEITTTGDANQSHDLGAIGTVGLFTKEIQRALLADQVDLAVHSLKDLPTTPVEKLTLAAVPEREVVADALVSGIARSIDELPQGARVGTGSLRRRSQLLRIRPDLQLLDVRGNVDTRLRKLDAGDYDALVLAAAGLTRLGLQERIAQQIPFDQMLPAPGQGALGIECRADDTETLARLAPLNDPTARAAVIAERTMLAYVEGGCLAAIGAHATVEKGELSLVARILSSDGTECLAAEQSGAVDDAVAIGKRVGEELLSLGARRLVQERR
ncbi:hydroxymethylbilane synthase [Aeoliella sp.]|uniref:hydroxymethylbilane synthase n=1 Tax=Aeoliella sp. TaxID=2795800 RepID=UPI003CCB7E20